MAPISKKRAAMELQSYHPLANQLNMTGYSSDSSNQGSSETSNSSLNNINLSNLTNNALNLRDNSLQQLSALQSLNALGLGVTHSSHLSALQSFNHSQLMSNLALNSLSSQASNASSSNNNSSTNSSTSNGLDANQLGKQYAKVNRVVLDKNSDEYRRRRERNNLAVKKSRTKSKMKTMQTLERVKQLKAENEDLQQRIEILSKELRLLKDIFVMHASTAHGAKISEIDLALLTNVDAAEAAISLNNNFSLM